MNREIDYYQKKNKQSREKMEETQMNFKKIGAVALTLGVLTGCGQTATTDTPNKGTDAAVSIVTEITSPVEITFWHAMNGVQEQTLTALTEEFMAANPNITVTLQNQSSYNELQQKMTATLASPKNLPTMTQAYADWMLNPVNDGLVLNLEAYINNEEIGMKDFDDIVPGLLQAATYNGELYGLPFNKSTEAIWYNKDLFTELNLEEPTTYEELAAVAKEITEKKGIVGAGFDSLNNFYTTHLKNQGVTFEREFDVTSEASQNVANYYLEGIKEGYFRIAGTDKFLSGPLTSETLGMYIGSTAGESFVKSGAEGKFEVGVAPYPAEYAFQQGTDLFVFDSASDEQKTAAFEYLKFLTSGEAQLTWATATGYMPVRQSVIASEEYKNSGSLVAGILEDATKNLYINPMSSGSDKAYREAATVLEGILADPNAADVPASMEAYKNTLETIWE